MKQKQSLFSLTISRRITLGILLILAMAGAIVWYSTQVLSDVDAANLDRNRMTDARKTARSLDIDVLRIIIDLQYYANQHDEASVQDILKNRESAKQERAKLRTLTSNQATIAMLDNYEALLPKRVDSANRIIAAVRAKASTAQISGLLDERKALDDKARVYLRGIIDIEEVSSAAALKRQTAAINSARTNLIAAIITLGVIVIVAAVLLHRSIVRPLRALTLMADTLKKGDLSAKNTVGSRDEFGILGQTMNDMAREVERTDDIKSHFISIASHQLRTPATAVKQNLGLIVEGFATSETDKQRFIRDAYESNEYQLAIIDDILNVARIESGKFTLTTTPTDIGQLIQKVVNEQTPSAKTGQKITYVAPAAAVMVNCDAGKIKMCVGNLLSNAMKYTPEHGHIALNVAQTTKLATITVKDDGVGIAAADIPKLFAKFSRVDNSLSAAVGGTGLGLYLVRELIKLHGGKVHVDSHAGKGSSFIIELPKE